MLGYKGPSHLLHLLYQGFRGPSTWVPSSSVPPPRFPTQDLVVPGFKGPSHFLRSPLMGSEPLRRDVLLYFRGDVGLHREKWYSRGVRQAIFR